ncbi:DUF2721 domain-containing protein [Pseudostreptobacillus sp.]
MVLDITTPAVMFPAISLLLLAYTNRFLALASIIRNMNVCTIDEYESEQIKNLKLRMIYIRKMQYLGVFSLLLCVFSMLFIFLSFNILGGAIFAISLLLMILSLIYSLAEIRISLQALDIHLNKCGKK